MSDARQAIAVARQAGAAQFSPDDLRAAEDYLNSAQTKLSERAYAQARSDAVQAKKRAIIALENSENSNQNNPPN
jgi:L-serine deaminase